jgi:hypothetical protein
MLQLGAGLNRHSQRYLAVVVGFLLGALHHLAAHSTPYCVVAFFQL